MNDTPQANPFVQIRDAFNKAVLENRASIQWLAQYRFWLLIAVLATLLCPVLVVQGHFRMGWHDGFFQTGAEVAVPSAWIFANGMIHTRTAWGVNPFALGLYGVAAYLAWAEFSKLPLAPSRRVKLFGILVLLALTLPLTFIPVCDVFVPKFNSGYGITDFTWGWFLLVIVSVALWLPLHADQLAGGIPLARPVEKEAAPVPVVPAPSAISASPAASGSRRKTVVWIVLVIVAIGLWKGHQNRIQAEADEKAAYKEALESFTSPGQ